MEPTTGQKIRELRLEKGLTQKRLGEIIGVDGRTVSKWENDGGLPDVGILPALSLALGADTGALLARANSDKTPATVNVSKLRFFVCPECKGLTLAFGRSNASCCGRRLVAISPKKAEEDKKLEVAVSDGDLLISSNHPMTKEDYIAFVAFLGRNGLCLYPQYPEWELSVRIPLFSHGTLMFYSEKQGLLYQYV
ncbi:MAG: helix-turn-helix transcriptional regulator [Clostridia bacterium]|nr:helix-turn-helix transcriptional regulator [Clostridia bacterium]